MKKLLSIILTILMLVTSVPFAFAADVSLVINMTDSYGDGWNGNAIQVCTVSGGEFTKIADVTFDEGSTATYEAAISDENAYAFIWTKGSFAEECSFSIVIGGVTVLEASDCNAYAPDDVIYITCNHSFSDSICSICGLKCGADFAHTMNSDGECTSCGYVCADHNYTNHYCKTCKIAENGYYAGACGAENMNDAIWSLDSQGTLTISGTGKYDVEDLNAPWLAYESSIKDVVIEEGITNIQRGSFYELSNAVSLSIPSTVNEIDAYANNYFAEFKLAEGNSTYALIDGVLFNADKTELIMYPVRKAGETYTVPAGVLILGDYSFSFSENLKTINISDDVTTMNASCFSYSSVETVHFGKNVNSIDYTAFSSSKIINIVLPEKLTEMSSSMFYACNYLENLVIGSNVISIDNDVINYCDALEAVHFTGTEAQWEAITKPEDETDRINTIPVHFGALEEKTDRDATCGADGHTAGLYCAECDAYLTGEVIPATGEHESYTDGVCDVCGYECPHEGYTNSICDVCGYICTHEGQSGSCQFCGANLGKLIIDVTDQSYVSINESNYDEDGIILTGTTSGEVSVYEACDLTFNNVTVSGLNIAVADNAVINIAFEGTNEIAGRVALYKEHLVFEGSDDATFKAARFYNGGNSDSSVTVNGGNMVLETVGQSIYTINCGNFIINDGTVTVSNDSYEVFGSPVKLNGGTLNVISTSESYEAIRSDIIMDKGALLTVSGAYKLIDKDYGDILKADGLTESDYFFVRYDTESEFTPVSDMKAALDGQTYAEIKIDTHEHSLNYIGKCICGYECTHESITGNKCDGCGTEGTIVTIEMTDSYGDGWNGNAVVIKHLVDGVYTEEGTATIEYGENGILTAILPKDSIYTFNWVAGNYSDECNFVVVVDGETVYSCVDGSTLTDGQVIYTTCQHDWSNKDGICAKGCGYSCPHENVTDGKCGVCGYECPHIDDVEKHFCTECGITVSECADENGDNICDICNALMGAPGIYVGGIYVDGSNYTDILGDADEGATVYYVPETNTLVLDGFSYEGADCGIICDGSLNIEVKGENKIVAVDGLCIYAEDDTVLNIGGTGKLDIEAIENGIYAASANDTDENIEINVKDSVTLNIDSAEDGMDIDGRKANKITVRENGSLNIKAVSEGITVSEISESVEILVKDNGTLTVDGEDECIYIIDAAKATVTFTDHAKISLVNNDEEGIYISANESETVIVSGNADVYIDVEEQSVEAETVIIDGGSLKAYSKKTYDAIVATDVTVNAGKLIVSSEDDYAIKADSIKITGGTLVAGNNTTEYPVFSVTPDFSEYNSAYMVLASEKADAAYLVEYDSANAENYRVITIQCKHELDGKVCKKCGFECGVDCGHYLEEGAVCAICGSIVYAITHQPTEAEPYVGLSDDTDASYQWYTVEENTSEITDENAATVSYDWGESSYDKETGWTGVPYEEDYSGQYFFTVAMKAGETVTVEVTGDFFSGVGLYDYESAKEVWKDAQEGVTTYELTVESAGNYAFYTYVNSGVVTVKAHKTTVDENAIDGETAAELKKPVIGKKHFCEVTFADGTTEISDAFEATHLHTFSKYEVTEEAECGKAGKEVASCDHGCGATDEREIPALKHSFLDYVSNGDATCTADGTKTAECENGCGETDTVTDEGTKLSHVDEDGDKLCDYGCGYKFEVPAEPETPDEPDTECDHICHKDGILGFFWKLISFFYRLFNIQQYCDCGQLHYDAPVFG